MSYKILSKDFNFSKTFFIYKDMRELLVLPQTSKRTLSDEELCYERIFYRNFDGNWIEREKEIPLKNILLSSPDKTKCLCPLHRKFEEAEISNEGAVIKCGTNVKGVAIPFIVYPDDLLKMRHRLNMLENYLIANKHLGDEVLYTKKRLYAKYLDILQKFNDTYVYGEKKLPFNVFEIRIFQNVTKKRCLVKYTEFDRKKIYDDMPFRLSDSFVKRPYITFDVGNCDNKKLFDSRAVEQEIEYPLPENLKHIAYDTILNTINEWAGKPLEFHTPLQNMSLLNAASFFPYEPNMYLLLKYFFKPNYSTNDQLNNKCIKQLSKNDTDVVSSFCQIVGAKPYRTLRKEFVEEPSVLFYYVKFWEMGFRDKNFFNYIFSEIKKLGLAQSFLQAEKDDFEYLKCTSPVALGDSGLFAFFFEHRNLANLKFFCDLSIPLRGEKATYAALSRENISIYCMYDTLRMFHEAYEYLSESERKKILQEGMTLRNHDMLAKIIARNANKNIDFKWTKEQFALEGNVNGYDFILPKDYYTLIDLGTEMHNCVASYKRLILDQTSTIVAVTKDGAYSACIEIRKPHDVRQKLGKYNAKLDGDVATAVSDWMKKHQLVSRY